MQHQLDAQSETLAAKDARIAALEAELAEATAYRSAIADVMAIIGASPNDVRPVLDKIADAAARLCHADYAIVSLDEGGVSVVHAHRNAPDRLIDYMRANPPAPSRGSVSGRAMLEKRTIHLPDVLADPEFTAHDRLELSKARTAMWTSPDSVESELLFQ